MGNKLLQNILTEEKEGFKIENLENATWAFRKLRAIANKEAEIKALAEAERNRVNSWEDAELKQYEADKQYFEYLLSEYYKKEKAKDKKFRLSTPSGKVTSKKTSTWIYEEDKLIDYIKSNDLPFIKTKEEIDKAGLKKCFKDGINEETGEVIPGITIENGLSVTVKVE